MSGWTGRVSPVAGGRYPPRTSWRVFRYAPRPGASRGGGATAVGGAAILLASIVLASCSDTPSAAPRPHPSTPSPGTTSPRLPPSTVSSTGASTPVTTTTGIPSPSSDAAVLAAYRAAWAAYDKALDAANAFDPGLPATMVDPVLEQVRKNIVGYKLDGIVGTGTTTLHPRVASLGSTTAVVLDCMYSASFLIYKKTGKQVPPTTSAEHDGVRATLVRDGTTWKVKTQDVTEGTCPAGY